MSKIAITYEKGGAAKTTTAVNVSAILAERGGYRVLLADLDHQSYATSYFDLYDESKPGVFELMQGSVSASHIIRLTGIKGLDILSATYALRDIETILMMKSRRQEYTLKNVLKDIDSKYDYILLDCPPSGKRIKTNALAYADYVILPTIPDDYAIHGLQCMAKTIVDIKQDVNQNSCLQE